MFAFLITVHVIACILLILIVLIQQGRGGGLIESFSSAESIFGTKTNTFLVKATSALAVVFFVSCLAIAFLSIQKNKSLIETSYKPPVSQPQDKKEKTAEKPAQKESPENTSEQKKDTEPNEKTPISVKEDTAQSINETNKDKK